MPVGLVSDEDYEKEMRPKAKRVPSTEPRPAEHGRNKHDVNVPDSLRKIIGEESIINGRNSALGLAAQFGISPSSVSAYAKGATSTASYNEPKKSMVQYLNKSRHRAVKRAGKVLNAALSSISQEKLDYTDPKDLSGIAKDMSVIIRNLEPQKEPDDSMGPKAPQFVIFAPSFRSEESFDVIDVKE